MAGRLQGKVALVTGSSRGIGRAIAELMASAGARVVVSSRKPDACQAVVDAIRARGGEAMAVACNVSRNEEIDALVARVLEDWGRIDALVLNAAVNPYMALDSIRQMEKDGTLNGVPAKKAVQNYIKAINGGLLKIFSKMGISTLASYQGAQIFEIVGINSEVVEKYFTGTVSRIEGLSLDDIARETLMKHRKGFPVRGGSAKVLDPGGDYHWRKGCWYYYCHWNYIIC